jgi:DeoR/GlpR family transcriptional regulator of sugar metabolism
MIERAARRFLLIDESKLDALSIETVCPLGQIDDLITSAPPSEALRDALNAAGTAIHVAGKTA